jgi:hypothetical protein
VMKAGQADTGKKNRQCLMCRQWKMMYRFKKSIYIKIN